MIRLINIDSESTKIITFKAILIFHWSAWPQYFQLSFFSPEFRGFPGTDHAWWSGPVVFFSDWQSLSSRGYTQWISSCWGPSWRDSPRKGSRDWIFVSVCRFCSCLWVLANQRGTCCLRAEIRLCSKLLLSYYNLLSYSFYACWATWSELGTGCLAWPSLPFREARLFPPWRGRN